VSARTILRVAGMWFSPEPRRIYWCRCIPCQWRRAPENTGSMREACRTRGVLVLVCDLHPYHAHLGQTLFMETPRTHAWRWGCESANARRGGGAITSCLGCRRVPRSSPCAGIGRIGTRTGKRQHDNDVPTLSPRDSPIIRPSVRGHGYPIYPMS
jgi:hypothetical protein